MCRSCSRNARDDVSRSRHEINRVSWALTYWRSGVGLPETDGFRLYGCLVFLDERRWRCQRSRLVAPMLSKSTCAAVQANAWQLDKHRVAQLKVKGRPPATALNCWSSRKKRFRLEIGAITRRPALRFAKNTPWPVWSAFRTPQIPTRIYCAHYFSDWRSMYSGSYVGNW